MTAPVPSPELANKLERTDRVIKISALSAIVLIVIALIVIIFQLVRIQQTVEDNLVISRAAAAENHKKTQQYIRCVAETLLKPLAERNKAAFDKCGLETAAPDGSLQTDKQSSTGGSSSVFLPSSGGVVYTPQMPNTVTPSNPVVTTSDPPENDDPTVVTPDTENSNTQQPGLVSGLVLGLGGLVKGLGL